MIYDFFKKLNKGIGHELIIEANCLTNSKYGLISSWSVPMFYYGYVILKIINIENTRVKIENLE